MQPSPANNERPQATPWALPKITLEPLEPTISLGQIYSLERRGNGGRRLGSGWIEGMLLLALFAVIVAIFFVGNHAGFGDVAVHAFRVSHRIQQVFKGQAVKPGTALILDSNPATRNVTKASLERQGYTVLIAGSKRKALEILEDPRAPIALIVTPSKLFDKALIVPGAQLLITH
jgi:hypothetical protein